MTRARARTSVSVGCSVRIIRVHAEACPSPRLLHSALTPPLHVLGTDQGPDLTCRLLTSSGTSSQGSRTLVSALRAPAASKRSLAPSPPQALWFDEQIVDHFVPATQRSHWPQRYYVNDTLWGGPGFPVFLYIGGEGPESGRAISGELFLSRLAEDHQALLVDVEHRFYGQVRSERNKR